MSVFQRRIRFALSTTALTWVAFLLSALMARTAYCDEPFPDVPKSHWAYQAVHELRDKGIFIGFPNGTFNGVVSQGMPKPKASYDLATPESTWKSLLRAMRDADEDGIKRILSDQYEALGHVPMLKCSDDYPSLAERTKVYHQTAARWSRLDFFVIPAFTGKDGSEIVASLEDVKSAFFMTNFTEIFMRKIGSSWRITRILVNDE